MSQQEFDVLIIGAGLSGIGMACQLKTHCPNKSFAILERRQNIGGTWDLFRYPGIRSDSDMFTFGYKFRPWTDPKVLADGESIRHYVRDTAREYKVEEKIQFGLKILRCNWSSQSEHWTVEALDEASGEKRQFQCKFLIPCTGYYKYDAGYMPEFAGREDFQGQIIHPQHWPEDLDYTDKKVVVIGSGATAVTLVPAMADKTAKITMLQRSPSYVMTLPAIDHLTVWMKKWLPDSWVYALTRWRNIKLQRWLYKMAKRWPEKARKMYVGAAAKQLGEGYDMKHFSPTYNPWDQRLCAVPDGDLFASIRSGKAEVVTDHIERFSENGIQLKSGQHLEADIIITATGLDLQLMGGMELCVDGITRAPNEVMAYKATMIQDAPNFAAIFGYTNATWTLKADIASTYVCRLLNHMDKKSYSTVVPRAAEDCRTKQSVMDALDSGYVKRADGELPRQGSYQPWQVLNHYEKDKRSLLHDPIEDGVLVFDGATAPDLSQWSESAA